MLLIATSVEPRLPKVILDSERVFHQPRRPLPGASYTGTNLPIHLPPLSSPPGCPLHDVDTTGSASRCNIGPSGGGFVLPDYAEASTGFSLPPSILLCQGQGYPSGNNPQTPSEPTAVRQRVFRHLHRTLLAPRINPRIELSVASAGRPLCRLPRCTQCVSFTLGSQRKQSLIWDKGLQMQAFAIASFGGSST